MQPLIDLPSIIMDVKGDSFSIFGMSLAFGRSGVRYIMGAGSSKIMYVNPLKLFLILVNPSAFTLGVKHSKKARQVKSARTRAG